MQDWNAGGDARDVYAGRAQLKCKCLEKFVGVGPPPGIRHQPANDRMGFVSGGELQHGGRSTLPVDAALQRRAGSLAMLRRDVARDQPDRGREHGGIVGEA